MGFLTDLWLPILLSAVFVFIASSVLHMMLPLHRSDYKKIAAEESVLESVRGANLAPGQYMFPCCESMKEMNSPEMKEKWTKGPVGLLTILPPGPPNMGKNLTLWLVFCLLISVFVAYLAHATVAPGSEYLRVFRVAGAAAFMGYGIGSLADSIWKGQAWSTTAKFVFDGLVYALVTAGTFGWLWPSVGNALELPAG